MLTKRWFYVESFVSKITFKIAITILNLSKFYFKFFERIFIMYKYECTILCRPGPCVLVMSFAGRPSSNQIKNGFTFLKIKITSSSKLTTPSLTTKVQNSCVGRRFRDSCGTRWIDNNGAETWEPFRIKLLAAYLCVQKCTHFIIHKRKSPNL